ncbi:MAG: Glycosyl transferase family 2 [Candidatus Gottesmanbacteria bacterium GW2011_GWA2_47_9]|uniref:dolichyl-phosphate beta-glucosyltransferase n=1 Tax=Candidatus Gottesmanbacteria bacterium GW2011_GWA2_47_9 TaxID=1618445 RepID=A0A0G1TZP5_9BACT|nr:MAG: Glycosyl transferase family 2 [Candidatus Gottesmanbacteria bacterium GW2011_GWA2_47_9]
MKNIFLSVVIPAYNEETNIRLGALDKVSRYFERVPYTWEVIVVDDGSTDGTRQLLSEFRSNRGFTIIENPHQGKAGTVITGMLAAKGEIVLFSDLDQAAPIREVEKLLPWFKEYDVVIGSRNAHREGAPLTRVLMARGFMLLRTIILGLGGIKDTQCGFKAFRRDIARDIFQRLKLYGTRQRVSGSMVTAGFDIEVLFLARKSGYRIKEVPIEWHYVETRRVSPLKDSWQGLMDIIKIRMNAWRGLYK